MGWIVHTLDERTMTPGYVDKRYKELFEEFLDITLENAVCPLLLAVDCQWKN